MGLTARQANAINEIINEEVRNVLEGRRIAARMTEAADLEENAGFEAEQHAGSPEQIHHQLHELMEGLIAKLGEDEAYEMVMDAWSSASREVASGVDSDEAGPPAENFPPAPGERTSRRVR